MSLYRDHGIVLRTHKLGEADRIVSFITERHGKVRAVAKGVRKTKSKFGARLEPTSHVALQLYEGYGFRRPGDEPLQINRNNPLLPRYLREALLPISELSDELRKHFARLQADGLTTQALRAAYLDVLRAFDALEEGKGWDAVEKALRVAVHEKARYQANRIAQTELHRAYAEARALELMDDPDVQWVQWRTGDLYFTRQLWSGRLRGAPLRVTGYAVMAYLCLFLGGQPQSFAYFHF